MSLLTLERSSPSPHDSENEDLLSTSGSSYEGFVARDHYALCLSPRPIASLGPGRSGDQLRIFSHLKKLVKILRPDDMLRMVVELESNSQRKVTKYLVIITSLGHMDTEETIYMGTEQDGSMTRVCVVGPLWRGTEIKLDGDGGFSVHTGDRQQVFKPSSVQSMWAALQMMYKAVKDAQTYNYYLGGLSHTWVSYYTRISTIDGGILNEWNLLQDVESFRPSTKPKSTEEGEALGMTLTSRLREVMLQADLAEVTCKMLRLQLEKEMKMDLGGYREFLDQQMLRILGQMERPSQIFDYLYLGTEWNASNLGELKDLGVKYILNISREIDNFYPEEFKYLNIRLYDLPNSELMKHWDNTYNFIKEAKSKGKKALVHCKMGISRSAATVTAYTMKEYKMSLEEALAHVKSKRSIVNPNEGFMMQLQAYEGILRARHNELWGKQAPSRPLPLHRARSQSEPNLLDIVSSSSNLCEEEPELSFMEEQERSDEERQAGDVSSSTIHYASSSHLDSRSNPRPIHNTHLSSLPVNKSENILNYLASLPNVAVEEDQGIGGDHAQCMSESGSGYSSPVSTPTDDEHVHTRYTKLAKDIRRDSKMKSEGAATLSTLTNDPTRDESHKGAADAAEATDCKETDGLGSQPTSVVTSHSSSLLPHVKTAPVPLTSLVPPGSVPVTTVVVPAGSEPVEPEHEKDVKELDEGVEQQLRTQIPVFFGIPKPLRSSSLPQEILTYYQDEDMGGCQKNSDLGVVADVKSATLAVEGRHDGSSGTIKDPQIFSVPERIKEIEEMRLQKVSLTASITPKTSPVPMDTSTVSPIPTDKIPSLLPTKVSSLLPAETKVLSPLPTKVTSPLPAETKVPSPLPAETKVPSPLPADTKVTSLFPAETKVPSPLPAETKVLSPLLAETKVPSPLPAETKVPSPLPAETIVPSPLPVETKVPSPLPAETKVPSPLAAETIVLSPLPAETKVPCPLPVETKVPSPLPAVTKVPSPLPVETKVPSPLPAVTKVPSPLPAETKVPSPLPAEDKVLSPINTEPKVQTETEVSFQAHTDISNASSSPPAEKLASPSLITEVIEKETHSTSSEKLVESKKKVEAMQSLATVTRSSSDHSVHSCSSGDEELQDLAARDDPATPPSTTRHASLSPSPQFQKLPPHEGHSRTVSNSSNPSVQSSILSENSEKSSLGPGAVKARVLDIERGRDEISPADELLPRKHSPSSISSVSSENEELQRPFRRRSLNQRPFSELIPERSSSVSTPRGGASEMHQRRETTPPALVAAWRNFVDEVPLVPVQDLKKKFEDSNAAGVASSIGTETGASQFQTEKKDRTANLRRTQSLRGMAALDKTCHKKSKKTGQIFSSSGRIGRQD